MSLRTIVCVFASMRLILGAIAPTSVHGQSIYGGVRGLVTDKVGAVVQDAHVTLTNEGTNGTRTTITNSAGEYVFSQVVPSGYTVSVGMSGFKKAERKGVVVETQSQVTIDVQLEIGNVTESISLTEEVPLLGTSTASLGQLIDRQKLVGFAEAPDVDHHLHTDSFSCSVIWIIRSLTCFAVVRLAITALSSHSMPLFPSSPAIRPSHPHSRWKAPAAWAGQVQRIDPAHGRDSCAHLWSLDVPVPRR